MRLVRRACLPSLRGRSGSRGGSSHLTAPSVQPSQLQRIRIHTSELYRAETEFYELELVDLVCEALDEGVEERYSLLAALGVGEVLDEFLRQLVP